MKVVRFREWECVVKKTTYYNGATALILNDAHTGEEVTVATVNFPSVATGANEVFIKDYSENVGVLAALQEAGFVKTTGGYVDTGFVRIPRCELLPPYREQSMEEKSPDQMTGDTRETTERRRRRSGNVVTHRLPIECPRTSQRQHPHGHGNGSELVGATDRLPERDIAMSLDLTEAPALITAAEFAKMLSVSLRTLWRLRSAGRVPAPIRLAGVVRGG